MLALSLFDLPDNKKTILTTKPNIQTLTVVRSGTRQYSNTRFMSLICQPTGTCVNDLLVTQRSKYTISNDLFDERKQVFIISFFLIEPKMATLNWCNYKSTNTAGQHGSHMFPVSQPRRETGK